MSYIIYNEAGEILRTVRCSPALSKIQAKKGEFIMEGTADDSTQKIVRDKVVNKTPEEIKRENPTIPKVPKSRRLAYITNEQWQDVLDRLKRLEKDGSK